MRILHDYECEQAETDICTCGADEARHYKTTIARLTAERDQARAEAAAAYERAARVADGEVSRRSDQLQWPNHGEIQINRWQAGKLEAELISNKIRALATEADTTALAEIVKKAVDAALNAASDYINEVYGISAINHPVDRERILARINHSKEPIL